VGLWGLLVNLAGFPLVFGALLKRRCSRRRSAGLKHLLFALSCQLGCVAEIVRLDAANRIENGGAGTGGGVKLSNQLTVINSNYLQPFISLTHHFQWKE
jgi:hypothetical protein